MQTPAPPSLGLGALLVRFLRFGAFAWGGPVAQIGVLYHELVERERWVDEARFRRVLAVYQALPGPEATELCVWFGTLARGRLGGLVAGIGFLLPGLVLMLLASWLLLGLPSWPPLLLAAFAGMHAAVAALVARAAWRLSRAAVHGQPVLAGIAAAAAVGAVFDAPFAASLVGGGIVAAAWGSGRRGLAACAAALWCAIAVWFGAHTAAPAAATIAATAGPPPGEATRFASGLRAGLLSFGGAYTAIPFLQDSAVGPAGWMTQRQFLDGLALGGVLPAPLVIFGTWVGFAGGGIRGALLLTLGIFLPAFAFPLLLHAPLERVVQRPAAHALLDGVATAVAGLIAVFALRLLAALSPWPGAPIAAASLVALVTLRARWTVLVVMAVAAAAGLALAGQEPLSLSR